MGDNEIILELIPSRIDITSSGGRDYIFPKEIPKLSNYSIFFKNFTKNEDIIDLTLFGYGKSINIALVSTVITIQSTNSGNIFVNFDIMKPGPSVYP